MIAISAKKRHGKDTVADYICSTRNYSKFALASTFKKSIVKYSNGLITKDMVEGIGYDREQKFYFNGQYVKAMFCAILDNCGYHASKYVINWEPIINKNEWSVRELMQTIGTDIGCNQVDQLIWMHPLIRFMNVTTEIVVSDCRQDHEMDLMRKFGAHVIHIINPYINDVDTHSTERGLTIKPNDKVIYNEFDSSWDSEKQQQSLLTLHNKIEEVLHELKI